jgi:hypothetical protein
MHKHASFSIHFRWLTILSILSLSIATSGTTWTTIGVEGTAGIDGICSIISSHWKNWQPLAWNTRLTVSHSTEANANMHIWKDAYWKVEALVEHAVKVLLCVSSVPVGEDMAI